MKLKRISALVLALAMTASTAAFAAGEDHPPVILDDEIIRQVNSGAMVGPVVILDDEIIRQVNSIAMVGPVVILDDEIVRDVNRVAMVLGDGLTVVLDDELVRQINAGAMIGEGVETFSVEMDDGVMLEVNHQQGDIWLLSAPMGGALGGGLMIPIAIARNYATTITINGEPLVEYTYDKDIPGTWESETITVSLSELPAVAAGYVPMRAVAQADGGYAQWFKDSNMSRFVMGGRSIEVSFLDMSVTVDGELVEGVQAILEKGTTYLPISLIAGLKGFDVEDLSEDGAEIYNIKTPNGAPLVKLARSLMETGGMGMTENVSLEDLELFWGESYGFTADMIEEAFVSLPMMINADTLILGKIADGQTEALEAVLEAYKAAQESTFSWYMTQNLPKVEDARFVTEGDWFLFLMSDNADAVVEQFRAQVHTLDAEA